MLDRILSIPFDHPIWFFALFIWTISWKGMALWKSARRQSLPWFVALLVVNTLGILEILYIYVFSEFKQKK